MSINKKIKGIIPKCKPNDSSELLLKNEILTAEKKWSELLIKLAPNIIIGLGKNSEILLFNNFAEKITGYKASEVIGKNWIKVFIPKKAHKEIKKMWNNIVKKKLIEHHHINSIITKNGQSRLISWNNIVLNNDKGNFKMVLSIGEDITEAKKIEYDLQVSETRYRRLFETAKDGILILDADTGKIMDVNPFLIDLLGYSYTVFLNKFIWEVGLFKDVFANKAKFRELQNKKYVRYEDLPLKRNDGKDMDVEFVSNVYTVDNKKVIQCNIRDITDRKRAELLLKERNLLIEQRKIDLIEAEAIAKEKTDRLRMEFLTSVSHELKQSIMPLIGYSELLERKMNNPELSEYTKIIIETAYDMEDLLNKLFNLMKLEVGALSFNFRKLNLSNVINDAISRKSSIIKLKSIKLETRLSNVLINGDYDRLKEVFTNLIDNAIKFSKQEGVIKISLEKKNKKVIFKIKDYGFGIRKEDINRLFVKFYRTKEGELIGGFGVGLALSKEVINLHKGTIEVKSEYGKGSEFIIKLPL